MKRVSLRLDTDYNLFTFNTDPLFYIPEVKRFPFTSLKDSTFTLNLFYFVVVVAVVSFFKLDISNNYVTQRTYSC